ncbi:MAG: cohesin domain-containing protein [Microgenomates group bacterium]
MTTKSFKNKLFFVFILLLIMLFYSPQSVFATDPHFFLSPTTGNFSNDFSVEIRIDTGNKAVGGVDVYLQFPQNLLKVKSVTPGTAFTEVPYLIKNEEGKLILSGYFSNTEAGLSFNGTNGLIATATFQIVSSGSANLNFICNSGETNESNIIEKTTSQDIVVCSANQGGIYTLSSSTSNVTSITPTPTSIKTPTPTSTFTSGSLSTPTSTPSIPVTGVSFPTIFFSVFGTLILLTGLLLKF